MLFETCVSLHVFSILWLFSEFFRPHLFMVGQKHENACIQKSFVKMRRPSLSLAVNLFSCRNQQMHGCKDVQLYSFIYYTDIITYKQYVDEYIKFVRKIFQDSCQSSTYCLYPYCVTP
jgi:hypothetical protein